MSKVLLINPSMNSLYTIAKFKSFVPQYFPLNLLTIAAPLIKKNHSVRILDLNLNSDIKTALEKEVNDFSPDFAGVTFTTPLYSQALSIISSVKKINNKITTLAGGVHFTSDCKNTMENSLIDIGVLGEADFKLLEILESGSIHKIKGIAYRVNGKIIINERDEFLKNLDVLPFPAVELVNITDYPLPHSVCRKNFVFPLETSRGCVFRCIYCNKSVFGKTFRVKSPARVVEDLKKIKALGYKEVHIMDDGFTTDINRAKEICKRIVHEKIDLLIGCGNGIRLDRVDSELLVLMKKAGIYGVALGIESGSQKVLDRVDKGVKIEKYLEGVKMLRKAGIESLAYFMIGLPDETEEDIKETIRFARKLRPDAAKFSITIPFPDTPLFDEWKAKGYILSTNWDDYGFYMANKIYKHPNLTWEVIVKYLDVAYRSFYLNPAYMIRKLVHSIKHGTLFKDIKMALSIKW